MATKKRSRHTSPTATSTPRRIATAAQPLPTMARTRPDWRWRTFPVFAAFAFGLLVAFLVNEGSANPVAFVLQIAALLGVGYSIAHVVVTNIITAGRSRPARTQQETEDVVVYPDEE